ncbi:serine protease 27 [Xenopus laevis]|uniref:Serine protease 27 n=1 Tax=Xenopus laevis TaxID=8355 RepID=A0A8J0U497_XENLA|nr:serine protease 27 [Xenopus laevis]OCT59126.1 hypothetical protein XELAEV_18001615mg [Xenopus laevis]
MNWFRLMRTLLLLNLGLIGVTEAAVECGRRQLLNRIMGGQDSKPGMWPWQVMFYSKDFELCGGTLITNNWVVSAAHCFNSTNPPSFYNVYLGVYQISEPNGNEVVMEIKRFIVHPNYTSPEFGFDIALVELSRGANYTNYIQPVCLPSVGLTLPTGLQCWVTGWGNIASNVTLPDPNTLQEVAVPLIGSEKCNTLFQVPSPLDPNTYVISNDMLCAGYINGGKDSCQGDSGGPLVCAEANHWYLVGVVSFGVGCGQPNRPGVYTRLNAYLGWIESYVPEVSANVLNVSFTGPFISLYNNITTTTDVSVTRNVTSPTTTGVPGAGTTIVASTFVLAWIFLLLTCL